MKTEIHESAINVIGGSWRPEWDKGSPVMAPMWNHIEKSRAAVRNVYARAARLAANADLTPIQRYVELKIVVDGTLPDLDPRPATAWARARMYALRRELTPADPADHRQVLELRLANPDAVRELDTLELALRVMDWTRNGAARFIRECLGAPPAQSVTGADGVPFPRESPAHAWNWTPPR